MFTLSRSKSRHFHEHDDQYKETAGLMRHTLLPAGWSRTHSPSTSISTGYSSADEVSDVESESDFGDWGYASWDEEHYVSSSRTRQARNAAKHDTFGYASTPNEDGNIIFRPPIVFPPSPPSSPPPKNRRLTRKPTARLRIRHVDQGRANPKRPSPIDGPRAQQSSDDDDGYACPSTPKSARGPPPLAPKPRLHDYNSFQFPVPRIPSSYIDAGAGGYREWEDSYGAQLPSPAVEAATLCSRYGHQPDTDNRRSTMLGILGRRRCRRCERAVKA